MDRLSEAAENQVQRNTLAIVNESMTHFFKTEIINRLLIGPW